MNRETKRMMQRKGQVGADGAPVARAATPAQRKAPKQRTSIRQFFREVREELRQVTWPTRPELKNYVSIVASVLIIMTGLIYVLNLGFSKVVLVLFQ
ncbi:MAG: preprotein translocase subunit SecE [Actinomycetota bacterium]